MTTFNSSNGKVTIQTSDGRIVSLDATSVNLVTGTNYGAPTEPAKPADCPHAVGTPEHAAWIRDNVTSRQQRGTDAYRAAKAVADKRLDRLRNSWGVRRNEPTFAYGQSVDDLLEFIEDDDEPMGDDADDEPLSGVIDEVDWVRVAVNSTSYDDFFKRLADQSPIYWTTT